MPARPSPDPLPRDPAEAKLVELYETAERQLRAAYLAAVARGGTAGAEPDGWRAQQLVYVRAVLNNLRRKQQGLPELVVAGGYARGLRVAQTSGMSGAFGGVHQAQVKVMAEALTNTLDETLREVGRRADDVYRRVALETIGEGLARGDTRQSMSAQLRRDLAHEGVTGFVDKAGRRWRMSVYTRMVARTTAREAASVATARRLIEGGQPGIRVSDHNTLTPLCEKFEGKEFWLTPGGPRPHLKTLPPFHPNCKHVIFPSTSTLDEAEKALGSVTSLGELERLLGLPPSSPEPTPAPIPEPTPPLPPAPRPRAPRAKKAPAPKPMPATYFTGLERVASSGFRPRDRRAFKALVDRGWIASVPDSQGRPSTLRFQVTPEGQAALDAERARRQGAAAAEQAAAEARAAERGAAGPRLDDRLIPQGTNRAMRDVLDHVASAIEKVHRLPDDLERLPLKATRSGTRWGHFKYVRGGAPIEVALSMANVAGAHREETLAHEVGHWLDYSLFALKRFGRNYGTSMTRRSVGPSATPTPTEERMFDLLDVIAASTAIQRLRTMSEVRTRAESGAIFTTTASRSHVNYLLQRQEMFARAYAQWIGLRAGSAPIMDAIPEQAGEFGYPSQWEPEDFEPIAAAFDALFRAAGMMD